MAALQEAALDPNLTGREHMKLQTSLHGLPKEERVRRGDELIERVGLSDAADRRVGGYSGGMKRRLDLALALVGRPQVLMLDEPMAGLSVRESHDLAGHLQALTSRWNVSVLLVEHDMDVVFGISHAITVFELGRVIASGDPAEVRANPRVREAYLGSAA